jgi:threonine synthase
MTEIAETPERPTFTTHLECSLTGERYRADEIHTLSAAGKPLLVRYDLEGLRRSVSRAEVTERAYDFWRYREFLPVRRRENVVSLGETVTPLLRMPRLERLLGGGEILVKDEGRLPTGSFKARGLALAVSMAKELGIKRMAIATAGNAGGALAAYATRAGIESYVFCPDDAQGPNVGETVLQGAKLYKVNGLINDCAKIVAGGKEAMGWFDTSTLKEPYRIEGKKTMGLEVAEQLGWTLPDVIFYPTGGGTGLIGMWKVFDELERIGWIDGKRPRMVAVQSTGCAPIVRAYDGGQEFAEPWQNAATVASGLRVPAALGDFLILRAIRESKGFAVAIPDEVILEARAEVGREEGLLLSPEGAATYAAYRQALAEGRIRKSDRVVLFNCGNGLKYPMPDTMLRVDCRKPVDYGRL